MQKDQPEREQENGGHEIKLKDIDLEGIVKNMALEPPDPVVYFSGIKNKTFFVPHSDKYKKVLFSRCKNFMVVCPQKLLTLALVDCSDFVVRLEKGAIGNVDVFRSHRGKVISEPKIPFYQSELSSKVEFWTEANATTHIVTTCTGISQAQKDWNFLFPLNEYSQRSFIMVEKSPYTIWTMMTEQPYLLNDIAQSIIL